MFWGQVVAGDILRGKYVPSVAIINNRLRSAAGFLPIYLMLGLSLVLNHLRGNAGVYSYLLTACPPQPLYLLIRLASNNYGNAVAGKLWSNICCSRPRHDEIMKENGQTRYRRGKTA